MPFNLELEKTHLSQLLFALEPAANCLQSMLLLTKHNSDPGLHPWVEKTRSLMDEIELFRHRLVITGFFHSLLPQDSSNSFPAYIAELEATPATVLRDRMFEDYAQKFSMATYQDIMAKVNWDQILASPESYIEFLKKGFTPEHVEDDLEAHAYEYVLKPDEMKKLIITHMHWFWKTHLESEWTRVKPMLEETIRAYQKLDFSGMTGKEIARYVTGQDLADAHWTSVFEKSNRIVIIPNAHSGIYIHKILVGDTLCIFFGAHPPEGSLERIPELDRAAIISRLSTLAEDTRLQILKMISEKGEMRAQDIIEATRLSQPSVSRYLSQLTAAGFLQERRVNTAKVYSLNHERIEKTLKAVSAFLVND